MEIQAGLNMLQCAAGPMTVSHVVDGLCCLWQKAVEANPQEESKLWQSHVLVKALRANPQAAPQLLRFSSSPRLQSYVLLSGEHLPHAWYVYNSLARRAKHAGDVTAMLVSHLACQSLATPQQQAFVECAAADIEALLRGKKGDFSCGGPDTPGVPILRSACRPTYHQDCREQVAGSVQAMFAKIADEALPHADALCAVELAAGLICLCFELLPLGVRLRPLLECLQSLDSPRSHTGLHIRGLVRRHLPQLALLAHMASAEDSWKIMCLLGWHLCGIHCTDEKVRSLHPPTLPAIRGVISHCA